MYLATKHFSYFLEGSLFTIQTDHQALVSAAANAKPQESAREVLHLQYLTTMHPKWEFIAGSNNNTADAISRATPPSTTTSTDDSGCVRSLEDHQQHHYLASTPPVRGTQNTPGPRHRAQAARFQTAHNTTFRRTSTLKQPFLHNHQETHPHICTASTTKCNAS